MRSEIVLYGHGSKDPQWLAAFEELAEHVRLALKEQCAVSTAFLQLISPTLDDTVKRAQNRGIRHLHILPIFLFPGQHVSSDIPEATARIRAQYPDLDVGLAPPIGAHDSFQHLVTNRAVGLMDGEM